MVKREIKKAMSAAGGIKQLAIKKSKQALDPGDIFVGIDSHYPNE